MKSLRTLLFALPKLLAVLSFNVHAQQFENPNNVTGYRADDAADALARVDKFLAEKLEH